MLWAKRDNFPIDYGAGHVAQDAAKPLSVCVFGFDVSEISQIRRIRGFLSLGHDVTSFTMRRRNMNLDFEPDWKNIHLYETENEQILKRAKVVLQSVFKVARFRKLLRSSDVLVARNLDMLAIAVVSKVLAGARAPIVYECLDIHGAMTNGGAKAAIMRFLERMLLKHVAVLAVSSPGFVREYFQPMQGWSNASVLWENKLAAGARLPLRSTQKKHADTKVRRIGWIGTIRCQPSLDLLAEVAKRAGKEVEIHIHGVVHKHALPRFDETVSAHPNIFFHGAYEYPEDLNKIYGTCDLVWAQDLWQSGSNSDWLLPNRIYEASWCGCPSIALASTETGKRIMAQGLGWTIDAPTPEALCQLLEGLSLEEVNEKSTALLNIPESEFVQSEQELDEALRVAMDVSLQGANS